MLHRCSTEIELMSHFDSRLFRIHPYQTISHMNTVFLHDWVDVINFWDTSLMMRVERQSSDT